MNRRYFGTDGVRGATNTEPMTAETVLRLAMAAGQFFAPTVTRHRPTAVIGKDTRLSGYMLEPAMVAGFTSIGVDVVLVGPMPTPAIAMLTRSLRADLGVMLSASHNTHEDNGIKLFGPDGRKLTDENEARIEELMARPAQLAEPARLGRARRLDDARGRYIEIAKATFPKGLRLDGLKLVVDCAHGASYALAPRILFELGADVIPIGVEPDGFNINMDCGAIAPEEMCRAVVEHGAHAGIALDGDGDRLVMADETGALVDGDRILALIAASWQDEGRLGAGGVVGTGMSNLGLERYLAGRGLTLVRASIGDRYVLEAMRDGGYNLGGEQSGHIIMSEHATTGDGILAALQVLAVLLRSDRPFSRIARPYTPFPQVLRNVRCSAAGVLGAPAVKGVIREGESCLDGAGRILVRASGTEPLIRVMVEGEDAVVINAVADRIVETVSRIAGAAEGVTA